MGASVVRGCDEIGRGLGASIIEAFRVGTVVGVLEGVSVGEATALGASRRSSFVVGVSVVGALIMGVSVIEASAVRESVKPSPKMSSKLSPTGAPVNPKPKKSSVAGAAVKSNPQISSIAGAAVGTCVVFKIVNAFFCFPIPTPSPNDVAPPDPNPKTISLGDDSLHTGPAAGASAVGVKGFSGVG